MEELINKLPGHIQTLLNRYAFAETAEELDELNSKLNQYGYKIDYDLGLEISELEQYKVDPESPNTWVADNTVFLINEYNVFVEYIEHKAVDISIGEHITIKIGCYNNLWGYSLCKGYKNGGSGSPLMPTDLRFKNYNQALQKALDEVSQIVENNTDYHYMKSHFQRHLQERQAENQLNLF